MLTPDDKRILWLQALEDAGVDNWEGIEEAHRLYKQYLEDEDS